MSTVYLPVTPRLNLTSEQRADADSLFVDLWKAMSDRVLLVVDLAVVAVEPCSLDELGLAVPAEQEDEVERMEEERRRRDAEPRESD